MAVERANEGERRGPVECRTQSSNEPSFERMQRRQQRPSIATMSQLVHGSTAATVVHACNWLQTKSTAHASSRQRCTQLRMKEDERGRHCLNDRCHLLFRKEGEQVVSWQSECNNSVRRSEWLRNKKAKKLRQITSPHPPASPTPPPSQKTIHSIAP